MSTPNPKERLMRFLQATPEQQAAIDHILEGKTEPKPRTGPLLLGMGPAAKFLGVSRGTLYRMLQAGRLSRVEILPGSFRVRREDVEAIAGGPAR
jgi:excisionase family DNA binding protein